MKIFFKGIFSIISKILFFFFFFVFSFLLNYLDSPHGDRHREIEKAILRYNTLKCPKGHVNIYDKEDYFFQD